jgi:3-dehydroquinate synthase
MLSIQQDFQVKFRYPIYFTTGLFAPRNQLFRDVAGDGAADLPKKVLFVIDERVSEHHPNLIPSIERYCNQHRSVFDLAYAPLLLPGGEAVKSDPQYVTSIQEAIHDSGICRHSFVAAIGGGALLDMAGYAAATAHRGVRLIRVPTTVLAQNDSGVGVKNSINAFGKKNFIGTFAPPFAVLNDFDFLTTLSDRDWRSGMAEAVKVSLIKDASFFDFIERQATTLSEREMAPMEQLIYQCARLHLDHIATSGDPFETGSSRPLDFGHWAAHKLEQLTGYDLRHGEAVAIGIALDTTYSYLAGFLGAGQWQRILNVLSGLGFKLYVPEMSRHLDQRDDHRCLLRGLDEFREHLGGRLTTMLLKDIGRGFETNELDDGIIRESISTLESRFSVVSFQDLVF